jgi:ribulose-phosphate 3-epimerase
MPASAFAKIRLKSKPSNNKVFAGHNPMVLLAPSMLSADFSRLAHDIKTVERAGADWLHVDVMDGHFVPNITVGPVVIRSLRKVSSLVFDVHLMIERPDLYWEDFKESGADFITFHSEARIDRLKLIKNIKKSGIKAGISIKPGTKIDDIVPFMKYLDMVLVMTVEPGFGGQKFMPEMLSKVRKFRQIIDENCFKCKLEVDGGINSQTAKLACGAGADVLVAGNSIFGEKDPGKALKVIKKAVSTHHGTV